jgi:hypothetical protein
MALRLPNPSLNLICHLLLNAPVSMMTGSLTRVSFINAALHYKKWSAITLPIFNR